MVIYPFYWNILAILLKCMLVCSVIPTDTYFWRNYFIVLEAEKFKVKVCADLVPGKNSFPGF